MDQYIYWLDMAKGIGKKNKLFLMEKYGSAKDVYMAPDEELKKLLEKMKKEKLDNFILHKKDWEPEKEYEKVLEKKIRFVNCFDVEYPSRLVEIPDAPFCLYYRGELPGEESLAVAIVGARECSEYGKYVAGELGKYLGEKGIDVISGMARGIDGISQRAALMAGGKSYGVLGCGVDICYPKENWEVYETLIEKGGVLSTYPPGTNPEPRLFPPRNRIVSGLADALVVVEARQKSGTLITVDLALEQGREVYACPGRVIDRLSDGCNKLIKDGANVFLSPEDFVRSLYENFPGRVVGRTIQLEKRDYSLQEHLENMTKEERRVYEALDCNPKSVDEIRSLAETREDSIKDLTTILMKLTMQGYVRQIGPGWFEKVM